jgi:putative nucleotidyltransferase with HDIG domain
VGAAIAASNAHGRADTVGRGLGWVHQPNVCRASPGAFKFRIARPETKPGTGRYLQQICGWLTLLIDGSPARARERPAGLGEDLGASAIVVNEYIAPSPARHLRQMLLATTLVAVIPLAASLGLRASGVISSGWLSVALAVAMSLGASSAGSTYWRKRGGSGEVLFSELLLWGWVRHWRQERELTNATTLLDLVNPGGTDLRNSGGAGGEEELTVERREQLLRQLAGALEGQDIYLNGHSRRVARHATMIARGMGLRNEEVARIRAAAAVHDVGKLRTPKAVLNKPGRLTEAEFEVIKRHPVDGAEMVAALGDPDLTRIVRHHHERLDGAGYPDRLTGDEIPLGARIIAVADTFDAITSVRPYRDAASHQKAIDILRHEAGFQLDPDAVRAFLAYYSGSRPTVVWAILTSSVRRFVSWLTGDPAAAATISASKLAAAAAATAAIGAAAGAAPIPSVHAPRPVVQAPRIAAAHGSSARPGGLTIGLHRHGVAPTAPAPSHTGRLRHAHPASRTPHRAAAHAHPASRRALHVGAAQRRDQRSLVGTKPASASHGTAGAVPNSVPRGTASPQTTTTPRNTVNQTSSPGGGAQAGEQSHPTPPAHTQGHGGNGNAYGHKSHGNGHGDGNGHGNGNGNGHKGGDANANTTTPATVPGNAGGQGNVGGNGQGEGSGKSKAKASASISPDPSSGPQANANGNGQAPSSDNRQGSTGGDGNGQSVHANGPASGSRSSGKS